MFTIYPDTRQHFSRPGAPDGYQTIRIITRYVLVMAKETRVRELRLRIQYRKHRTFNPSIRDEKIKGRNRASEIVFKNILLLFQEVGIIRIAFSEIPKGCSGTRRRHTGFRDQDTLEIRSTETNLLPIQMVSRAIRLLLDIGLQYNNLQGAAFFGCHVQHTVTSSDEVNEAALAIRRPKRTLWRHRLARAVQHARHHIQFARLQYILPHATGRGRLARLGELRHTALPHSRKELHTSSTLRLLFRRPSGTVTALGRRPIHPW